MNIIDKIIDSVELPSQKFRVSSNDSTICLHQIDHCVVPNTDDDPVAYMVSQCLKISYGKLGKINIEKKQTQRNTLSQIIDKLREGVDSYHSLNRRPKQTKLYQWLYRFIPRWTMCDEDIDYFVKVYRYYDKSLVIGNVDIKKHAQNLIALLTIKMEKMNDKQTNNRC